jgi:deoxyribonuclease-4
MRVGAHVTGGASKAADRARAVGAEAVQFFASFPRAWTTGAAVQDNDAEIAAALTAVGPLFFHEVYLVNLASPREDFRNKSYDHLAWTMERAQALHATGVVVHTGAGGPEERARSLERFREGAMRALAAADEPLLVIELMAGGAGTLASTWAEARELLDVLDEHPRARFCFDTCHAFSAGYDLASSDGMRACLQEMRSLVGADRLALIHANDSRDARGSKRDRHWHIGEGTIGLDGFAALVNDPIAEQVPLIVETPDGGEKHAEDIARLRALAKERS